jgi:hypothetical protein
MSADLGELTEYETGLIASGLIALARELRRGAAQRHLAGPGFASARKARRNQAKDALALHARVLNAAGPIKDVDPC